MKDYFDLKSMLHFATICDYNSYSTAISFLYDSLYNMLYIYGNTDIGSRIYVSCLDLMMKCHI